MDFGNAVNVGLIGVAVAIALVVLIAARQVAAAPARKPRRRSSRDRLSLRPDIIARDTAGLAAGAILAGSSGHPARGQGHDGGRDGSGPGSGANEGGDGGGGGGGA